MNEPKDCLRCQGKMELGFVLDRGPHHVVRTQDWVQGEPERSFWSGIKTRGKDKYSVRTFRCERCGYLEAYAR